MDTDKPVGKVQALKELLESNCLPDGCVVYILERPVIDMSDLVIPEQTKEHT